MKVIRLREAEKLSPLSMTLLCLVGLAVAGGSLLLSAPESVSLVDGALPWSEQSPLRAVVQVLCLSYDWPTRNAGAVKIYVLGIAAGLAMAAIGLALLMRGRPGDDASDSEGETADAADDFDPGRTHAEEKRQIAPLNAAQFLVLLYLLWSFASSRWSAAPDLAVGGSLLITIYFLWSLALGHGLNGMAVKVAARLIVGIAAVTACVAVWYYYGRNPTIRAKFPFGNPQFLAACLIPGIILAATLAVERLDPKTVMAHKGRSLGLLVLAAVTLVAAVWAFLLADSRGAMVGLIFGLLALIFFAVRGWPKALPLLLALGICVAGWFVLQRKAHEPSATGRDVTARFRLYAWEFAWDLFLEKPVTGQGQGGFALDGDGLASNYVLKDPEVFTHRVAHAHNEWLEVLADLGSVGLVLIGGAFLFTLVAGAAALRAIEDRALRWTLIGLLAALVALVVEEVFGVGLRVSGVPTLFYTLIGLIWAASSARANGEVWRMSDVHRGRGWLGGAALTAGLASLVLTQADFSAARHSYEADRALDQGNIEQAIADASLGTSRLNPQRALTNMLHLAEAHLQAALKLQQRGLDREDRAHAEDPPSARLAGFAARDFQASDAECLLAARSLKEVVTRSPTFLNHGYVDYMINMARASNAAAMVRVKQLATGSAPNEDIRRKAQHFTDQCLRNAAAAAERELHRQPFNPRIAVTYVSAMRDTADAATLLLVLARPLRYGMSKPGYANLLNDLSQRDDFDRRMSELAAKAERHIAGGAASTTDEANKEPTPTTGESSASTDAKSPTTTAEKPSATGDASSTKNASAKELVSEWSPELLRLAATAWFVRGDYAKARRALESAVKGYLAFKHPPPLATPLTWAELADCRLFDDPLHAESAIDAAEHALKGCPPSEPGRSLHESVEHRMLQFLLAAGRETDAHALLKQKIVPGMGDEGITRAMGAQYRQLYEAMLARRAGQVLRRSVDELSDKMHTWIHRALKLAPDDPKVHHLAADLALHDADYKTTARELEQAVALGLPLPDAMRYLAMARQKAPDAKPLNDLWERLSAEAKAQAKSQQQGPPGESNDIGDAEPSPAGPP